MPLLVTTNCPDLDTARAIAETLVVERLAASVNIGAVIESTYRWNGNVAHAGEIPVTAKTRPGLWEHVALRIRELHPYECPAIWGSVPDIVDPAYAEWVEDETRAP